VERFIALGEPLDRQPQRDNENFLSKAGNPRVWEGRVFPIIADGGGTISSSLHDENVHRFERKKL
jgi:hypothetical protein